MTNAQAVEVLARNVNAELTRRHWDMTELARRADLNHNTIYRISNRASRGPNLYTLCAIAEALHVEPADLLRDPDRGEADPWTR